MIKSKIILLSLLLAITINIIYGQVPSKHVNGIASKLCRVWLLVSEEDPYIALNHLPPLTTDTTPAKHTIMFLKEDGTFFKVHMGRDTCYGIWTVDSVKMQLGHGNVNCGPTPIHFNALDFENIIELKDRSLILGVQRRHGMVTMKYKALDGL